MLEVLTLRSEPGECTIEPIVAWRTWTLAGSPDGGRAYLLPIAGDGRPWPSRTPAVARCAQRRTHTVPALECTCGLHAVYEPHRLRKARDPAVVGTIALWGRVVEHAHGLRARFGYPQRLRLVCYLCFWRWAGEGGERCEHVVRHRGGRMVPLCPPHLELSRRYGYPIPRLLDAGVVQGALLETYAVDLLPIG